MRTATGLVLAVLGVAVAVAWWVSGSRCVEHRGNGYFVRWERGKLLLVLDDVSSITVDYSASHEPPPRPPTAWTLDADREIFALGRGLYLEVVAWTRIESMGETMTVLAGVAWPVPLGLWCVAGWMLWPHARERFWTRGGRCRACGFNLVGLNGGVACPECGDVGKSGV